MIRVDITLLPGSDEVQRRDARGRWASATPKRAPSRRHTLVRGYLEKETEATNAAE